MDDGRGRVAVYAKALKEFNALQQSVLDVAQDAGLIDPESRKLWEHEFYVPFYRVMEEDQSGTMGPGQIGGLVGQRAFKKLKGGQEKLGDLLGNTLSNWRSEEHTSELQSLMRISYAVFCLKKQIPNETN